MVWFVVVVDLPERGEVVVVDSPEREGVGGGAAARSVGRWGAVVAVERTG